MHSLCGAGVGNVKGQAAQKPPSPPVSVVSLSHNRRRNVLELVEALTRQDYGHFEIILVDNASTDGTVQVIQAAYPKVRLLTCSRNFGMVSYNFGLASARGKYVLVVDDDGLPGSQDWISQMVDRFESNPRLGAIACTVRMRDTGRIAYDSPQFVPHGDPTNGFPAAAYNGTGAGLRAAALHEVGYYPFHFFRSWLELHLCTRLIEAGWQVRHFPSTEVWHSRPSGSVIRPATYHGLRNYLWYVWTFYPWPQLLGETAHFIGSRLKSALSGQGSLGVFAKAMSDALTGWPRIASERQPISNETLAYLRHVQKFWNDHDVVPSYRSFSASLETPSCD